MSAYTSPSLRYEIRQGFMWSKVNRNPLASKDGQLKVFQNQCNFFNSTLYSVVKCVFLLS